MSKHKRRSYDDDDFRIRRNDKDVNKSRKHRKQYYKYSSEEDYDDFDEYDEYNR